MNQLKRCHTQTRQIDPLAKVALKPFAVDDPIDAQRVAHLTVTLSILSSCVETLFYPSSFYTICLADSDMIAWDIDSGIKCYFPRHKKWQVQRGPQNPDGGPILTGDPKYYDTGPGGFFFFFGRGLRT